MSRYDLDRAFIGTEAGTFPVGSTAGRAAVAIIEDDILRNRGSGVGPIHEHGPLIDVGVTAKHEIDAPGFQNGHNHGAHFDELLLLVTVMGSFGVGRMMPKGDQPVGPRFLKVGLQPLGHDSGRIAGHVVGIETNEMGAAKVEGIIGFGAAGQAAGLGRGRRNVGIVVGAGGSLSVRVTSFVITHGRPTDCIAQGFLIGLEEVALEFTIQTGAVGHVTDVQITVESAVFFFQPIAHRGMNPGLHAVAGAAVAHDPK